MPNGTNNPDVETYVQQVRETISLYIYVFDTRYFFSDSIDDLF